MASSELFGRNISFGIESQELPRRASLLGAQPGATRSLATFSQTKLDVSLTKDSSHTSENTGQVIVTNPSISTANAFISLSDPLLLTYTLRAGYGEDTENLPIISRGYITQTDWNHQGGDSSITFSITEGSKLLKSMLNQSPGSLPAKRGLTALLDRLRGLGQEIEFVPDEGRFRADVAATEPEGGAQSPKKSVKQLLTDLLGKSLYDWHVDSGKIVIYKRSGAAADDLINYRANKIITLGFDTGLLSADAETTVDSEFGFWIPWLAWKSLFIPDLLPLNVVEIAEPLYPHLNGQYKIQDVSYSLTNKSGGDFIVSGRALPLNYRDAVGRTQRQILQEFRGQERSREDRERQRFR